MALTKQRLLAPRLYLVARVFSDSAFRNFRCKHVDILAQCEVSNSRLAAFITLAGAFDGHFSNPGFS